MIEKLKIMVNKIYKDSLLKNSVFMIVTHMVNAISGFFFWVIAARYYTPDDIGIIAAILSSIFLISTMSLIGFPTALIFYLPRFKDKANEIINSCLIICILVSIFFSTIFILGIDIFSPKLEYVFNDFLVIFVFIVTTVMTNISGIITPSFTAGRRSSFYMIKENIFALTKLSLLIIFTGFGFIGILLSWSIGLTIAVIAGFILLFKLWRYRPVLTIDPIVKNMVSYSSIVYMAAIFYTLPKLIFPIIILNTISSEAAGYFYIAMAITSLLYGIPISISSSFLAESSNKMKFWNNVVKSIKFNIILLTLGVLLLLIFGRFLLNIFNPSYAENSLDSMMILALTSIPMSLIVIYTQIKNAQNEIKVTIIIHGMVAAITFILAIYLIRIWNIEGIAVAYLIANTIVAMFIIFRMKCAVFKILNGKDLKMSGL